ncbi:hypothetical protein [Niabella aquatica]
MKKSIILFAFISIATIGLNSPSFAQSNTPATIPDCQGNTLKSSNAFEKSALFNSVGVDLYKYDWKNPTINCHINETIKANSKRMSNLYGAAAAGGGALGLLTIGLVGHVPTDVDFDNDYGYPKRKISVAPVIFGLGSAVLSYYLFNKSKRWKSRSENHLTIVQDYFRMKGL